MVVIRYRYIRLNKRVARFTVAERKVCILFLSSFLNKRRKMWDDGGVKKERKKKENNWGSVLTRVKNEKWKLRKETMNFIVKSKGCIN